MQFKVFDKNIVSDYSEKIIELLNEVLDINGIIVDEGYSERLVFEMGKYIDDGSAYIVGAFDGEQLIGLVWCYRRVFNQEERLHIYHFIIDKSYRGAGMGQKMIDNVFEYAKKNNIHRIDLMATSSNKAVLNFYRKNDFVDERILMSKKV